MKSKSKEILFKQLNEKLTSIEKKIRVIVIGIQKKICNNYQFLNDHYHENEDLIIESFLSNRIKDGLIKLGELFLQNERFDESFHLFFVVLQKSSPSIISNTKLCHPILQKLFDFVTHHQIPLKDQENLILFFFKHP